MSPKKGQPISSGGPSARGKATAAFVVGCVFLPVTCVSAPVGAAIDAPTATLATAGAIALAIAAGLWAVVQHRVSERLRRAVRNSIARARAAVGERDALISAGQDALLVWGRDGTGPFSYGGGEMILESCLEGADATGLSQALDDLGDRGSSFTVTVHDKTGKRYVARGRAVGGMAAVWLRTDAVAHSRTDAPFQAILDALPFPVWLRDKTQGLSWANRAYVSATGAPDLETVRQQQIELEKSQRDHSIGAHSRAGLVEARRYATIGGQRRALSLTEIPFADGGTVGAAVDVTDAVTAETKLRQHIDAHADTLDKLATAVATFGSDQRLTFYNRAFAKLWELPESWLKRHPTDGEILDRLRDAGKLPERREYQVWKRQRLSCYETRQNYPEEETWHLPGGRTLRVMPQPHPFGGLTFLYEDVTERFALESSYNTLSRVQSATLDTLQEGVAVFGPDGRLKLHNAAFVRIWDLAQRDLASEPHIRAIAAAAVEKFGDQGVWEQLIRNVVSGTSERHDLPDMARTDQTILSVSLSALPDGATLVTFADVTDRSRIESALRDRNEALVAADKLKTDFVQHASFLFRDPLNVVRGFADLLAQGVAGPLSDKQSGYVQNILTASERLEEVTSDILDLALIDAGAMRLELSRIKLYELLTGIAAPRKKHAESLDITLIVDCSPDVGIVVADERRLKQVAFNLLTNAFAATPRGGRITLGGAIKGDEAQIWVADTGSGMAPDIQVKAFERFEAGFKSGQLPGAGLGLALVRRFIELHDGWVEIESEPDKGTIVRCHLPRRVYDQPPPETLRKTA
jgi:signal transduction histidine kinase